MNNDTTATADRQTEDVTWFEPTPAELRAKADAMEANSAKANKGKVYILSYSGTAIIHDGFVGSNMRFSEKREATEAEVKALCTIPEFAAYLKKVRGEA
jgi:hypothetical protein